MSGQGHGQGMHGQGHDEMHWWYKSLKQPGTGVSCCNDEDCRPTVARMVGSEVQVQLDGEWIPVPPDKILRVPSPDLASHVCAPKRTAFVPKGLIYCVVLGSGV